MKGPKQLGHLVIRVRDLDKAEEFYTRILGLKIMQKYPDKGLFMSANEELSHKLAIFRAGDDAPGPDEKRVGLVHMAFQMDSLDDLREIHRRLKSNNINLWNKAHVEHPFVLGMKDGSLEFNKFKFYLIQDYKFLIEYCRVSS